MIKDIWKPITGYEGLYEVCSAGFVRRMPSGKVLKPQVHSRKGYLRVDLYKNNQNKHIGIHRLVAKAFIPNPENKPTVEHMDGDKTNNHVDNLIWATYSEQMQTAPCLGYYWNKNIGKWHSQIMIPKTNKHKHIGFFEHEEDAHAAYIAEKYKYHPFWVKIQEILDNRPPLIKVDFKLKNQ